MGIQAHECRHENNAALAAGPSTALLRCGLRSRRPERILSPPRLKTAAYPDLDLPGRRRYALPIPQKGIEREWLLSDLV
jgi:hypothetical protein